MIEELLSFEDFIEKYKYKRSDEVIGYELYLIIKKLDKVIEMKTQRFDYYDEDFYDNGRLMGNDEVLILLNQAENKIDKLQKRNRRLFLLEKIISQMLPMEKQEELYNRLYLELIRDEHD